MDKYLSGQELASRLGIGTQALLEWERELKLEVPGEGQQRWYDDDLVAVFEIVKDLRDDGNGFRTITRVIGGQANQGSQSLAARLASDPHTDELQETAAAWQARYDWAACLIERLETTIRERDRLLGELQRENGRLRQREGQAIAFLSDTVHELKAPLSAIMGYSELLQRGRFGPLDAEQAEIQDLICRRAMDMKELLDNLQDSARHAELEFRCAPQVINPGPVLAEALRTVRPQADTKQQSIQTSIPAGLPQVLADPVRLRQIVLNLLGNAIRYTQPGGRISLQVQASDPQFLTVAVGDDGPGIDPAELPQLFTRFYRAGQEAAAGTGLGLAIACKLVEQLGGKLWAASQPGQGATFSFTLPLALINRPRPTP